MQIFFCCNNTAILAEPVLKYSGQPFYWVRWGMRLKSTVRCVSEAFRHSKHRWLCTELIRLVIFTVLGIRHTCCSEFPPHYGGGPRHTPEERRMIQEEDAFLNNILEISLIRFDAEFDTSGVDIETFLTTHLFPEMYKVLTQLKQEDEALHKGGRDELGLVMETECMCDGCCDSTTDSLTMPEVLT